MVTRFSEAVAHGAIEIRTGHTKLVGDLTKLVLLVLLSPSSACMSTGIKTDIHTEMDQPFETTDIAPMVTPESWQAFLDARPRPVQSKRVTTNKGIFWTVRCCSS